jgi:hypothetical protein
MQMRLGGRGEVGEVGERDGRAGERGRRVGGRGVSTGGGAAAVTCAGGKRRVERLRSACGR